MSIQNEEELLKKLPPLKELLRMKRGLFNFRRRYMDIRSGDIYNTSKVMKGEYMFDWLNKQPPYQFFMYLLEQQLHFPIGKSRSFAMELEARRTGTTTEILAHSPTERVHESLWMEFLYGEYYYGSAYSCLAYALDQPMNVDGIEEGNVIRKGARRIWRRRDPREKGVFRMEFDSFISKISQDRLHLQDPTEVQNSGLSSYMYSCENLTNHEVPIVMVPFPAQGHLNQLLQLSCLISSYGLPVYYVGSATHNGQARIRANALNPSDIAKVHFHDLPTPEFDSPSPDFNALNKFPSHLQPSWDASMLLREPIASFLRDISSKARRVIVVHDPLMSYNVQDVSSLPNVESYVFNCISVFTLFHWLSLSGGISI
ncbi:hypothetical protein H5410_019788 [Solanum commersonii]|uniref:Glycosyltransferase N-terminal domain-containing protein n=1 Tax=Solanum commersonii TaxID=4109 RepID=A0A9J5Z678_SOLCO|nr:hypothetical protein H5410_019788 [Solanum commersonii]